MVPDVPLRSRWDMQELESDVVDDCIPFPWQRFVQNTSTMAEIPNEEANEQMSDGDSSTRVPNAARAPPVKPEEQIEENAEFTIKQGMKRKVEVVEEEQEEDESPINSSTTNWKANEYLRSGLVHLFDSKTVAGSQGRGCLQVHDVG